MKSKILAISFLFIVLGCQTEQKVRTYLWEYIPENTSILFKINDYDGFKEGIDKNDFLSSFKRLDASNSIAKKVNDLKWIAPKSESLLAFSKADSGKWDYTFISDFSPDLIVLDSVRNKKRERITIHGKEIEKYEMDNSVFYASLLDGKIAISSSRNLLENLLNNDNRSLPEALKKLFTTSSGSKIASLFIDLNQAGTIFKSVLKNTPGVSINNFSEWLALDINLKSDDLGLRGISMTQDSTNHFINLFRNTTPLPNKTVRFAPRNTQALLSYTFNDFRTFSKNRKKYLNLNTPQDSLFATVDEIGYVYLDTEKVLVLNTFGAENILDRMRTQQIGSFDFQGNEILNISNTYFLEKSLSPLVQDFNAKHVAILENAFLFCEDRQTLQDVIRNYKNGSTWDKEITYRTAMEHLASESSLCYIATAKGMEAIIDSHFSNSFKQHFSKSNEALTFYTAQVIADRDFFHTNAIIKKIPSKSSKKGISEAFTITLDKKIATNPQFVINHNTNNQEIVVQDEDNNLYLLSNTGKILWKKKLEGRIQGQIHQVDIYKNKKLQLAFTTNNQFLILDRNGKEVKPFVKTYEGGNLNPLAVFDYDGRKDYRFVVTQNEKVFMYNNKGDIVKGFKYTQAEKPIIDAPKHFRIGRKDYLVFQLLDGSLKILNRIGKVRVPIKRKFSFTENEIHAYKKKFIITDKEGALHQIDEKGKVSETNLNLSEDHGLTATSKTLVLMDNNQLSIKGNKVELDLGVYLKPRIFYLYDKIYVSVTDIQNQRVYLFDSNAKPISQFPVFGISHIDLTDTDNDRKLEFVVKNGDSSIALFRIN